MLLLFGVVTARISLDLLLPEIYRNDITLLTRKTLVVIIDLGQHEKFFEQLKRFDESYAFDIHIGSTTPSGDTFNINMLSKDVMIIANNVSNPTAYDINFYDKDPVNATAEEIIESLINDLKSFISEVPNVTINEKK